MFALWFLLTIVNLVSPQVIESATDLPSIYYSEPSRNDNYAPTDFTELSGGSITGGQKILDRNKSPYIVREDLFVERGGELVLEPGVEIRFAPMIGLTVRGIITAKVIITPRLHIPKLLGSPSG